ncbi:MAG: hypothetical protein L3K14_01475 [Thermoplasmata archaeon]|nr:hypothetical protein [Thermoplasmata archaeon]
MPGTFRSAIQKTQEGSDSVRTTIPEGVAKALEAAPGGNLVWTLDLKAGRVTVAAEPPGSAGSGPRKSSMRD